MATEEHFRTGNPDIHYSGYPGTEFPHQCGGGYGYGGHSDGEKAYGTYDKCNATHNHYKMNEIDYNGDGISCGTPPMKPIVSDCNAPLPEKPAVMCGPCDTEHFNGGGCNLGCAKPVWYGDVGCSLPPKHCGAGSCGYYGADGGWRDHGQAGFETFDGAMTAYADDAHTYGKYEVPIAGDCNAKFEGQHEPGCHSLKCTMPYSAPYHVGPGCGRPTSRCADGGCGMKCCGGTMAYGVPSMPAAIASSFNLMNPRNLLLAAIAAFIIYKLFRK